MEENRTNLKSFLTFPNVWSALETLSHRLRRIPERNSIDFSDDHAISIAKHDSKISACQSDIQLLFSGIGPVQSDLKSTDALLSTVETLSSTAAVSNSSVSDALANNRSEALHCLRRSHNILFGGISENSPEGDRVEMSHIVEAIDPSADNQCLHFARVGKAGCRLLSLKVSFNNPITDFVHNLSILSRGSLDEKLRWAFTLYDINGDGCITREEMTDIVNAVYDLMGKVSEPCIDDNTVKEKVDRIFQKMDKNRDGVVTLDEFLECCQSDADISSSMAVFDSSI
ncbi:hypothetical protein HHI36_013382 [Cryptolaemus montrouzieri]|uniref:EF-hand domain-containing protein n=1 Tax=Cryptolaemus montrouzieri TaxID=559131 RepID=A0ABD2NH81_9CUCU